MLVTTIATARFAIGTTAVTNYLHIAVILLFH